ncbi:delta-class carbonic anhydrase [Roseibium sp. Sym1]|uniref:delta-class carbonic anhydrase n=1 Tax=Roseibium sp. Sym1 TaxID=3016006 RepID=UPI0022B50E48|nr:delta-class carbonic anhydrase [Roseibium sp. Sym1]
MTTRFGFPLAILLAALPFSTSDAEELCEGYGPQTPRDISSKEGLNAATVAIAPAPDKLNLCNIHTHTNAEHKAPGFAIFAGEGEHGGYKCNGTEELTDAELAEPAGDAFRGVKPGDTIEVHWVFSSCNIQPGKGLGACLSDACANPQLRVEAQSFLVVNDANAPSFLDFVYDGNLVDGRHQPKALPAGTGDPVTFIGSTTGPNFDHAVCSPLQVTWSVRPQCTKLDINSLHAWAEKGNVFEEDHSHGVRQLVTAPELLAPITN